MDYYVSLGVPAGRLSEDASPMIIMGDQMLSVSKKTYAVWSAFVGIRSVFQAAAALKLTEKQMETEMKTLLESGIVVSANDVLHHTAIRQGLGWGYDANTQDCVINWGGPIHVPHTSYMVWCCCDGKMELGRIVGLLRKEGMKLDDETARKAVHTLLRRNVLLLVT